MTLGDAPNHQSLKKEVSRTQRIWFLLFALTPRQKGVGLSPEIEFYQTKPKK